MQRTQDDAVHEVVGEARQVSATNVVRHRDGAFARERGLRRSEQIREPRATATADKRVLVDIPLAVVVVIFRRHPRRRRRGRRRARGGGGGAGGRGGRPGGKGGDAIRR